MAGCLLFSFILMMSKIPPRAPKGGPGAGVRSADLSLRSVAVRDDSAPGRPPQAAQPRLVEAYGKLPLSFELNRGQSDSRVKFLSRGSGYSLFLTVNEAVLFLRKGSRQSKVGSRRSGHPMSVVSRQSQRGTDLFPPLVAPAFRAETPLRDATDNGPQTTDAVLRMKLVGANPRAKVSGLEELPGKSNYFIGSDPKKWRTNVPNYAKVKYANVYPGVDLVYYGNQGKLEYDFVVQPAADPRSIQLAINPDGQAGSRLKGVGSETDVGAGLVPAQGGHPRGVPLRIDGNGELVVGVEGGEVVFCKPVIYQPTTYSKLRTTNGGGRDLIDGQYVLRGDNRIAFQLAHYDRSRPVVIDPTLAYSTYLGGNTNGFPPGDQGNGIAVDALGNAYVTGSTVSSNFPITAGGFQTTYGGGDSDAFVSKLNTAGSALVYSTYLGGNGRYGDVGRGIAVDASGSAYVTGSAAQNFPTTPGAFQPTYSLGRGCSPLCPHAFVTKLNASGSGLVYSTYLQGTDDFDPGSGIAVDASGDAYVTGSTLSLDFPTTSGAFQTTLGGGVDAYVTKLNPAGSALVYSTYLGGSGFDVGSAIAVDASGNTYVTGGTIGGFPITPGAFQTAFPGGELDAFVSKLNASGSALVYSTYLGGSGTGDVGRGIAVDPSENAYVTGRTESSDFPTTPRCLSNYLWR
jgi:hypothetical protein